MLQSDPNNVFARIITGEIPCHKIYEDDNVLAFLDIHPASFGHTLVVPKKYSIDLWHADSESLKHLVLACHKISLALKKVTNCSGLNMITNCQSPAGQVVPHLHFHLIPRYEGDQIAINLPSGETNHQMFASVAKRICEILSE